MKALSLTEPGHLVPIELPEAAVPAVGEALVAIRAIGICGTDIAGYLGKMPFIEYPRILGHELGVEVLSIGAGVTHLKVGDRCAVEPYLNCGDCHACRQGKTNCCETLQVLGVHCDGAMRGRMILPADKLHPCNELSFEQLALVETLAIGCHAVNRANILPAEDVLIIGAGPIGLTVLEFVRLTGAAITVLDLSESRRAFVKQHYAGVRVVGSLPDEPCAQVVFDATGHAGSMARTLRLARFGGRIVYVGITKEPVMLDDPLFHRRELTLLASRNAVSSDFPRILGLIQAGQIDTRSWITHRCDFAELPQRMAEWVEQGAAQGAGPPSAHVHVTMVKAVVRGVGQGVTQGVGPPSARGILHIWAEGGPAPCNHTWAEGGPAPCSGPSPRKPRYFNPFETIHKTANKLEHWQQPGATYFLTFRLGDSMPAALRNEWQNERETWLLANPKPWTEATKHEYHETFSSRIDKSLDAGYGACHLREAKPRECLVETLMKMNETQYFHHAWVIMPNHVHVLVTLHSESHLEDVVGAWKSISARQINRLLGRQGAFWQEDYFDRLIRDPEHFANCLRYIRQNPEKAGLAEGAWAGYEQGAGIKESGRLRPSL